MGKQMAGCWVTLQRAWRRPVWKPRHEKQSLDVGTMQGQVLESAIVLHSFVAQLAWDSLRTGDTEVTEFQRTWERQSCF